MSQVKEYLMKLGLADSQARVLIALFDQPTSTAKELSSETKIPHTKIYGVLDTLELKGLVNYTLDTPKVYKSLAPRDVFEKLVEQQKSSVGELESSMESVLSDVEVNLNEGEEQEFESKMWVYNTPETIWGAVVDGINSAKSTIHGVGNANAMMTAWTFPGLIEAVYGACVQKNVKHLALYPDNMGPTDLLKGMTASGFSLKKIYQFSKSVRSDNYELRVLPDHELQNEFLIIDGRLLGIAFRNKQGEAHRGLFFQDKTFAQFMINYFEGMWERAQPSGTDWGEKLKELTKRGGK